MTEYRYRLLRDLGGQLGAVCDRRLCWCMLNPSLADDTLDDPTMRRVIRFTRDAGYHQLEVVNLFAARATRPCRLYEHADPEGPANAHHMRVAFARAHRHAEWARWRANDAGHPHVYCLGTTADGSPRHPLYVPADQPLVPYLLGAKP